MANTAKATSSKSPADEPHIEVFISQKAAEVLSSQNLAEFLSTPVSDGRFQGAYLLTGTKIKTLLAQCDRLYAEVIGGQKHAVRGLRTTLEHTLWRAQRAQTQAIEARFDGVCFAVKTLFEYIGSGTTLNVGADAFTDDGENLQVTGRYGLHQVANADGVFEDAKGNRCDWRMGYLLRDGAGERVFAAAHALRDVSGRQTHLRLVHSERIGGHDE